MAHLNAICEDEANAEGVDMREVMVSYTLEAISNCGFGVEAKAFSEPNGQFKLMVRPKITRF